MAYGGELRANTAVDILIGPFVDDTDGKTAETGLTIDVEVSKNGQALADKNDITAPVHDAAGTIDGYYNCELDTTDTNTEGTLAVVCFSAGALPVRHDFMVLSEAAWDSKYVAKDDGFMDVNVKTVGRADTQETEANNLEAACAAYSATRGLTGTALPAAAADAAGGVPISDLGGLDLDAQIKTDIDNLYTAIVTNAAGTDVAADIIAVKAETAELKAAVITNAAGADVAADIIALKAVADTVATDTATDIPALIAAIQAVVDLIEDIVRNQLEVTNSTGTTTLRADNSTDALYTVVGLITDNSTTTIRKRLA